MERNYMEIQNYRTVVENVNAYIAQRRDWITDLASTGSNIYPQSIPTMTSIGDIIDNFDNISDLQSIHVVGSVTQCKRMGDDTLLTLMDQSGDIQICLNRSYIGNKSYSRLMLVAIGAILRIDGARFLTQDGEMAIKTDRMHILSRGSSN